MGIYKKSDKFTKLICLITIACTLHTDLAYGNESIDKNCNLYRFVYFSNLIETSAFLNAFSKEILFS